MKTYISRVLVLGLLLSVAACGQMGPLQLPEAAAPVAGDDQEEGAEADER